MKKKDIIDQISRYIQDNDNIYLIRSRKVNNTIEVSHTNIGIDNYSLLSILNNARNMILKKVNGE